MKRKYIVEIEKDIFGLYTSVEYTVQGSRDEVLIWQGVVEKDYIYISKAESQSSDTFVDIPEESLFDTFSAALKYLIDNGTRYIEFKSKQEVRRGIVRECLKMIHDET